MQGTRQFVFAQSFVLCALAIALLGVGAKASAQQPNNLLLMTFPPKADVPNQDQHLTSATAWVNSVFDHSMLGANGLYAVYGCDKTAVAFTGTTAIYGPGYPILRPTQCNDGYKVQNLQHPPAISLAPDMNYSGWGSPGYLFYDGHPGIDYHAAMDTQVYAAVNGTVHYPARMVGLGYPATQYHVLEIVPDHLPILPPPYVIYDLHLDTYIGQNKMPVSDPDPLPGCSATVYLPLDEGTHVQAGCLVALSGNAAPPIFHYSPHLHLEVHKMLSPNLVSNQFGARTADICIDGAVGANYDCVPVDSYGWTGAPTSCDSQTGLATSGDPYYCLTGVISDQLWK